MKPLRLVRIVHSLDPAGGGVAEAIRQFGLAAQENATIELTVATLDAPTAPWLEEMPFKVIALGPRSSGYGYTEKLRPWLREYARSFDIAVIDGLWQYHGFAVHRELKGKIPYYVMPHGMLDPWFKENYPLKHLKKWLYWLLAEFRILKDADGVIFTAEEERRKARDSFWLYRTQEEFVAPLGIQTPEFDLEVGRSEFRQSVSKLNNAPYLIFLGRLHEKKGVDLLIEAYLQFARSDEAPPVHLVLAGPASNPEFQNKLERAASESPTIHFPGPLMGDAKWAALKDASALILPSHQENFGLVVVEALAVGTPVLLSNKVNIWAEVIEAKAGLVEENTVEGAYALISKFSENISSLPEARRRAEKCYRESYELQKSFDKFTAATSQVR